MQSLTFFSVHTIYDNADRIKESTKSVTKMFVARLLQSSWNELYQKLWMGVS